MGVFPLTNCEPFTVIVSSKNCTIYYADEFAIRTFPANGLKKLRSELIRLYRARISHLQDRQPGAFLPRPSSPSPSRPGSPTAWEIQERERAAAKSSFAVMYSSKGRLDATSVDDATMETVTHVKNALAGFKADVDIWGRPIPGPIRPASAARPGSPAKVTNRPTSAPAASLPKNQ